MKKVKVTQKQFDWLEKYKSDEEIDYAINIQSYRERPDSPIADWKPSKVAKALYVGYEVEPEFKLNDYVWHTENEAILKLDDEDRVEFVNKYYMEKDKLRHATPEEIAEEKERRFWKKHGREPWELKLGDLLISNTDRFSCDVKFVEASDETGTLLANGKRDEFLETIEEVKNKYDVLVFAHQRLDREGGE